MTVRTAPPVPPPPSDTHRGRRLARAGALVMAVLVVATAAGFWFSPIGARWRADAAGPRSIASQRDPDRPREGRDMDGTALREVQQPLKERYREDPDTALVTLSATGYLGEESVTCSVDTGRQLAEAGLHPATSSSVRITPVSRADRHTRRGAQRAKDSGAAR